jgi:uncharacterized membrane protein (UPF0182 family)
MRSIPRGLQAALIALLLVWMLYQPIASLLVDWWWFDSLDYGEIFTTSLWAKAVLFVSGLLFAALFLGLNVWYCDRQAQLDAFRLAMLIPEAPLDPRRVMQLVRGLLVGSVLAPALVLAAAAAGEWFQLLCFLEPQDFGSADPVFRLDVGFYVFRLPLLVFVQTWLTALVSLTVMLVAGLAIGRDTLVNRHPQGIGESARRQLTLLGVALFVLVAAGWWLERFELLFSREGVVWGAGYTDLHARLPAAWIMLVMALLVAGALVVSLRRSGWRIPVVAAAVYVLARLLLVEAWPAIVQDYRVKPNELGLEREYLEHNIQSTRLAYALDRIEVEPFEAASGLDMDVIRANPLTIENVRVWDDRPLLTTYSQIQEIRLYYDFVDVDVDRYTIDGKLRQVMLAGRELNYNNVPAQARSWVNEHFQYTHGYGITMSPVNKVTNEGLPELFIQDIPPVVNAGPSIDRPEIYYGELTDTYVFVNTGADEFDYPDGERNAYTRYAGEGGVPIGSLLRKLVFAVHFRSLDILLSGYLEPDSRVMFRRTLQERVQRLAPFLSFDDDPYMVVDEGRLYWIIDAYTTSPYYPYAEPLELERGPGFNYIRNAVKVVVDAYHGSVELYIADPDDPLVRSYAAIFEGSFQPLDAMPEGLRQHIRYPVGFFDVQGAMYRAYHMTDPTVFYNKEDMWALPKELYGGQPKTMQSYYLVTKLPGEEKAEFILLVPFVPTERDNMISWMAARCDPEVYGRLLLYQFPKQKLIYGPMQIEARIDQDPAISEMMTLWSQAGSKVIRGNLLVIPIGDSLMYVEPVYLQAESSKLPELKRVIVSYENRIAMEDNLERALRRVFAAGSSAPSLSEGAEGDDEVQPKAANFVPQGWRDLAHDASAWFERAQRRQTEGDWAGYGEALEALADSLSKLERMAGDGEVTSNAASQEEALEALSEEEPAGVGSETPDPPQE